MSFLNAIRPLLRDQAEITLKVSASDDSIKIVILPRLASLDADATDDLAHLQSVLSMPLVLTLAKSSDLDESLAEALRVYEEVRRPVHDDLDSYRERVRQEQEAETKRRAEREAAAKEKSASKTVAKGAAKPAAAPKAAPAPVDDLFATAALASQPPPAPAAQAEGGNDDPTHDSDGNGTDGDTGKGATENTTETSEEDSL